jgi:carboxypeptidase C (cathepsin A)
MAMNPHLKVFVANGYFDLATPYLATIYTFNHLSLEPDMQKHISMGFYQAGHMMYIHRPSLAQLKEDLQGFIISSLPV